MAGNGKQDYIGDGAHAADAQITFGSWAVDGAGAVFYSDSAHYVREISIDGIISTVAGNGKFYPDPIDGVPATRRIRLSPTEAAADSAGNLFIKEARGIRKVSPSGIITTVLSAVPCVYSWSAITTGGDQSPCIGASMAGDAAGNLFFQDYFRIRKLSRMGRSPRWQATAREVTPVMAVRGSRRNPRLR